MLSDSNVLRVTDRQRALWLKDPEDETVSVKKFDEWGWSKNNTLEFLGTGCDTKSKLDVWRDYRFKGESTLLNFMDFPDGSEVKNGPAMQETQVRSLGGRHFLENFLETLP